MHRVNHKTAPAVAKKSAKVVAKKTSIVAAPPDGFHEYNDNNGAFVICIVLLIFVIDNKPLT